MCNVARLQAYKKQLYITQPTAHIAMPLHKPLPADGKQQTLANQMADFAQPPRPRAFWPRTGGISGMHW